MTQCPYKGEAQYYDLVIPGQDPEPNLIWYYRLPTLECSLIAGALCFYNEKVDIKVDYKSVIEG
jgi:uncharacterized protein (DUF427 family)